MNFFSILIACFFLILTGCSDKVAVEDPPVLKPTLVIELFDALKEQNYEEAISKIKVLRQLNDNIFLAQLEEQQRKNLFIAKIQKAVDLDQTDDAKRVCNEAMLAFPKDEKFESINKTLVILTQIKDTVNLLSESQNWVQISRNSAKLKSLANSFPPAKPLIEIANQKLLEAKEQMLREHKLSIISLCVQILTDQHNSEDTKQVLLLLLSIVDPKNPILLENYPK